MFDEVGNNIKNFAVVYVVLSIISSIVVFLGFWNDAGFLVSLLLTVAILAQGIFMSHIIYGFGILVDNSQTLVKYALKSEEKYDPSVKSIYKSNSKSDSIYKTPQKNNNESWTCKNCKTQCNGDDIFCKMCGTYK